MCVGDGEPPGWAAGLGAADGEGWVCVCVGELEGLAFGIATRLVGFFLGAAFRVAFGLGFGAGIRCPSCCASIVEQKKTIKTPIIPQRWLQRIMVIPPLETGRPSKKRESAHQVTNGRY